MEIDRTLYRGAKQNSPGELNHQRDSKLRTRRFALIEINDCCFLDRRAPTKVKLPETRFGRMSSIEKISDLQPGSPCEACGIRTLSICGALAPTEIAELEAIVRRIRLAPRQMVFYEGDDAGHFYNVTEGTLKIYKLMADGRRQITGFLFAGDFLGLAIRESYTYSAEAVSEVNLCRFPRADFEALLDKFPKLERRLLKTASNELAAAQDQMLLLGRKAAQERIATFLLHLSDRAARREGGNGNLVQLPMSRNDIGDYLGLTIETVSRSLTRLRKLGAIELPGAHLARITNRSQLMQLASLDKEEQAAATASF